MIYVAIANGLFALRAVMGELTRRHAYWAVLLGLFLFSAFRFKVGCDWSGYLNQYNVAWNWSLERASPLGEPIWWFILRHLTKAGVPYPWVHVISSATFFAGAHVLAKRQPDRFAFLVLLFPILIINVTMSADRQACAVGLMCVAFAALQSRNVLMFACWTLLAAGFHASALTFLLLTPLATGRYTATRVLVAAALAVPGALALARTEVAQTSVERYVGTSLDAAGAVFRVGLLAATGVYFQRFLKQAWARISPGDYALVNVGSLAMIGLAAIVPVSSVIADRFGYYFVPIQAMMIARIPYLGLARDSRRETVAAYAVLSVVLIGWTLASRLFELCYTPYQSWLLHWM